MTDTSHLPVSMPAPPPPHKDIGDEITSAEARALHLNRRLAETFGDDGVGYEPSVTPDRLFAYGVLGGKDVGKSTLINSLAGSRITDDGDVLGEGTHDAAVYVHHADVPAWNERCAEYGFARPLRLVPHDRDVLRNVVLVDLPDFDSRFRNHLDYVREFQPMLDGVVWLATPQKYRDRLLQDELRRLHREGFMFVLNKADWVVEIRGEATPDELRERFSAAIAEALDGEAFAHEDVYIISAKGRSYDFPQLQNVLVREHSPQEIARRKSLNRLKELAALLSDIDRRFDLCRGTVRLEDLLRDIGTLVEQTFGEGYRDSVLDELTDLPEPHRRQSAGLLYHRLERWPLLRLVLWPLRWIISFVGGRVAYRATNYSDYDALEAILDAGAQPLPVRLEEIRERLELKHRLALDWVEKTGKVQRPPGGDADEVNRVVSRLRNELLHHDRERLEVLKHEHPPPGRLGRMLVWLPPLWFVLVQPLLEATLEVMDTVGPDGAGPLDLGLSHILLEAVRLLSAGALLEAAALLVLMYTLWVIKIYADCARWVSNDRRDSLESFWDRHFTEEIADLWRRHYEPITRRMAAFRDEWQTLSQSVGDLQELLRDPESRRYLVSDTT